MSTKNKELVGIVGFLLIIAGWMYMAYNDIYFN